MCVIINKMYSMVNNSERGKCAKKDVKLGGGTEILDRVIREVSLSGDF